MSLKCQVFLYFIFYVATASAAEFRPIDLYQVRNEKIIWSPELSEFSNRIKIKNPSAFLLANDPSIENNSMRLQELRFFYEDSQGVRHEIRGASRADFLKQWQFHLEFDRAESIELVGSDLIISNPEKPRIQWKAVALKEGINLVYFTLLGGSIIPEAWASSKIGKRLGIGRVRNGIKNKLQKEGCRNWIAAIGARLPAPAAAVGLDLATRKSVAVFDLTNQHEVIQRQLHESLKVWEQLQKQPPSKERDLQLAHLLPKIQAHFSNLKMLAHEDSAAALANLVGRDSTVYYKQGTFYELLTKVQKEIAEDREIINQTQAFTQMNDAHLNSSASYLGISRATLDRRIHDLQSRLNRFQILTPDADLRRYQRLRSNEFQNLKTRDEMSVRPLVIDGEVVTNENLEPIMIDDFSIRLGLERRLTSTYQYLRHRNDLDEMLANSESEFLSPSSQKGGGLIDPRARTLSLSESLADAAKKSHFNSISPESAYKKFIETGAMPTNALDALNAEVGFYRSFANPTDMILLERQLKWASEGKFSDLANSYWNTLRGRLTEQYESLTLGDDATMQEALKAPTTMPEEFWNSLLQTK